MQSEKFAKLFAKIYEINVLYLSLVGFGVAGTRDLLNKKPGSREPIAVVDGPGPPLYANVDTVGLRSATLPVNQSHR